MGRLELLLQEYCPDGVKYFSLGELGTFYGGITGKSKEDFLDGNEKFITYKNVYSNPSLNITANDKVRINNGEKQRFLEYGDIIFTGSSETPDECGMSSVLTKETDEKLYLNSFCFIFRLNDNSILLPDFSKHLFRSSNLRHQISKTASGVTRFNVSKKLMEKILIPVPPIEVQREIVNVLDKFLLLKNKLTEELEETKAQYQYYIDSYFGLTIDEMSLIAQKKNYEMARISDIGKLIRGKRFVKADSEGLSNGVPCIHYGELYTHYGVSATVSKSFVSNHLAEKLRFAEKNDVIIVGAGENNIDIGIGVAWFGEDVAVHDACYILKHSLNPSYLSFYLRSSIYHKQIKRYVSEGKICSISAEGLGKAVLPIPPMHEQERIVAIFDKFNRLCNDLELGIPAEIKARTQQYDYYRDKWLTFKANKE